MGWYQPEDVMMLREETATMEVSSGVRFDEGAVAVSVVMFTDWGGFYRRAFIIDRAFPHRVLDIEEEELVPFDCGVMF